MEIIQSSINDNSKLFESFNNNGLNNTQNYIPIYNKIFDISDNLYEKINIKKNKHIENIDFSNNKIKINNNNLDYFIKYSPIINPTKYLIGEYNLDTIKLPNNSSSFKKKSIEDYIFYISSSKQVSDYEVTIKFLLNNIKKTY